jgi:hypothetical protein
MKDLTAQITKQQGELRDSYFVHIRFLDKVLGTQPRSEEIMRKWLESKHLDQEIIDKQVAALGPDNAIDEEEDRAWTTFQADEFGIFIGTYQVKAMIKELLSSLGITVSKRGSKQTLQHLFEVAACNEAGDMLQGDQKHRLRMFRDGEQIGRPDDYVELTAHVRTPQGDRSVIKRHDYVLQADLYFRINVPKKDVLKGREKAHIGPAEIVKVMAFGENDAIGCSRSQGYGKFKVVQLLQMEEAPSGRSRKKAS